MLGFIGLVLNQAFVFWINRRWFESVLAIDEVRWSDVSWVGDTSVFVCVVTFDVSDCLQHLELVKIVTLDLLRCFLP